MRMACDAGYLGARAGRIPRKLLGSASSPWSGTFVHIPGE
jgi:thiazole synthase ThiGH ThiG subunit